jgi:hypothetical protein
MGGTARVSPPQVGASVEKKKKADGRSLLSMRDRADNGKHTTAAQRLLWEDALVRGPSSERIAY